MSGAKQIRGGGRPSRERLRCWLGASALAVAAASLALVPVQAAGAEPPPDVASLATEIEERIASLGEQGKANAQARWRRALAAVRCEPGAMSLEEIERRAGKRFNTELWQAVLAAARLCADDAAQAAEPVGQAGPAVQQPSAGSQSGPGAGALSGLLGGVVTPESGSDGPPPAVDPADPSDGGDGGMPPDAKAMASPGDEPPPQDDSDEFASVEPAQDPPNSRPERLDAWPISLYVYGADTRRLSLTDEFSDPDGDNLSYTVTVDRNFYGGGATASIESGELVVTTSNTASHVRFVVTAKDGSSDCGSSGNMECRARTYINVRVREVPQRSDSDYVDISVRPHGYGNEGLNAHPGAHPQGCVPFAFDLSKAVPRRFNYEYMIVPVPESTVLYGLGGSNKGAPASFFDGGTTNVWHSAGFMHRLLDSVQTSGGFCVSLKGKTAVSRPGGGTVMHYTDHCPAGEKRHFYVEMRIPDYWANLLGLRMVDGKTRAQMNLTCQ